MWEALLVGFAREVIPAIWAAIKAGDADRAAQLARGAASRVAMRAAAVELLKRGGK